MEPTPTHASNRPKTGVVLRLALTTGLGALVVAFAATAVAVSTSATAGITVRALLVTVLLVVTPRAVAHALRDAGDPVAASVVAGVALGYAVAAVLLGDHVYAAQVVVDGWPARVLVDALAWIGVGTLASLAPVGRARTAS